MWRSVLLLVFGCSDGPNVCDQQVAEFLTAQCLALQGVDGSFDCLDGGSGTGMFGSNIQFSGTATFDACVIGSTNGTITITGPVTCGGDTLNNHIHGHSDALMISGRINGCTARSETCVVDWDGATEYEHHGTLCGRAFP